MDNIRHLVPMRVTHLLVKFDNLSLSYSWWNLSVQCNRCCLAKNVFGWDIYHQKHKNNLPSTHLHSCISIQDILFVYQTKVLCPAPSRDKAMVGMATPSLSWPYTTPVVWTVFSWWLVFFKKVLNFFLLVNWALLNQSICF